MVGTRSPEFPNDDHEGLMLRMVESIFLGLHSPDDFSKYVEERIARLREYKPTWLLRNDDSDQGRCYDFYNKGQHLAMIDYSDGVCDVYVAEEGAWKRQGGEPVRLGKAVIDVEALLT